MCALFSEFVVLIDASNDKFQAEIPFTVHLARTGNIRGTLQIQLAWIHALQCVLLQMPFACIHLLLHPHCIVVSSVVPNVTIDSDRHAMRTLAATNHLAFKLVSVHLPRIMLNRCKGGQ